MKASELRALPVNELEAKMKDLKEEYLRLRCGHVSSQLADVVMIKKTRRPSFPATFYFPSESEPPLLRLGALGRT